MSKPLHVEAISISNPRVVAPHPSWLRWPHGPDDFLAAVSMNLRERVEALLPNWQSWYPSLFDAAADLGLIRARVCPPSQLMISNRHASIYNEAVQAFREQWSVEDTEAEQSATAALMRGIKAHPPHRKAKPR